MDARPSREPGHSSEVPVPCRGAGLDHVAQDPADLCAALIGPRTAENPSRGIARHELEISGVMQRSTDRIRTTHVGSLARPAALLDLMKAAAAGERPDPEELAGAERRAVADVVAWQRAAGLDVV